MGESPRAFQSCRLAGKLVPECHIELLCLPPRLLRNICAQSRRRTGVWAAVAEHGYCKTHLGLNIPELPPCCGCICMYLMIINTNGQWIHQSNWKHTVNYVKDMTLRDFLKVFRPDAYLS